MQLLGKYILKTSDIGRPQREDQENPWEDLFQQRWDLKLFPFLTTLANKTTPWYLKEGPKNLKQMIAMIM